MKMKYFNVLCELVEFHQFRELKWEIFFFPRVVLIYTYKYLKHKLYRNVSVFVYAYVSIFVCRCVSDTFH